MLPDPIVWNGPAAPRRPVAPRIEVNGNLAVRRGAFTLLELLVVMAIMVAIMALVVPAFSSLKSGNDVTKAAYDIAGALNHARAYAMANATYVFVGIAEVDASVDSSAKPQLTTGATPHGRVALAIVASKDGTKHYTDAAFGQGSDWQANYSDSSKPEYNGGHLMAISKLQQFQNLHLASSPLPSSSASMARPAVTGFCLLGNATSISQTPFTWPLGSSLAGGYQYRFDKVIEFDPQGVARIIDSTGGNAIVRWIEVGLQQAHGNLVSSSPNGAAIQIDGMTGAIRIYRP